MVPLTVPCLVVQELSASVQAKIDEIARRWPELADLIMVSLAHGNRVDARIPSFDVDALLDGLSNVVVGIGSYAPWSQVRKRVVRDNVLTPRQ